MKLLFVFFTVAFLAEAAEPGSAAEWNGAGVRLYAQARYRDAEVAFRRALEQWNCGGSTAVRDCALATGNLGSTLAAMGRFGDAGTLLLDSLHRLETISGPESADAGRALQRLGALYRAKGDSAQAESYLLRAGGILDRRLDDGALARSANRLLLASTYVDRRRFAEAESLLQGAAESADGGFAALSCNLLAAIALAQNRYADAETLSHTALDRARAALPAGDPAIAATLNNLAQAYRFQGRYLEAERTYRQAIEIWEGAVGPSHPDLARGIMNLAAFYHERGYEAGAETLYRRAARMLEATVGSHHPQALVARDELAEVLRAERRYTESEKLGRASLAGLEKELGPDDPRLARAIRNYARLLAETKRPAEAAAELKKLPLGFR